MKIEEIDSFLYQNLYPIAIHGMKNMELAGLLLRAYKDKLPLCKGMNHEALGGWNAQELANRSCQRLRKKGLIYFVAGEGWYRK